MFSTYYLDISWNLYHVQANRCESQWNWIQFVSLLNEIGELEAEVAWWNSSTKSGYTDICSQLRTGWNVLPLEHSGDGNQRGCCRTSYFNAQWTVSEPWTYTSGPGPREAGGICKKLHAFHVGGEGCDWEIQGPTLIVTATTIAALHALAPYRIYESRRHWQSDSELCFFRAQKNWKGGTAAPIAPMKLGSAAVSGFWRQCFPISNPRLQLAAAGWAFGNMDYASEESKLLFGSFALLPESLKQGPGNCYELLSFLTPLSAFWERRSVEFWGRRHWDWDFLLAGEVCCYVKWNP